MVHFNGNKKVSHYCSIAATKLNNCLHIGWWLVDDEGTDGGEHITASRVIKTDFLLAAHSLNV